MSHVKIRDLLLQLAPADRQKLLPNLSEHDFQQLLLLPEDAILQYLTTQAPADASDKKASSPQKPRWFDQRLCGLTAQGKKHLEELENTPDPHTDRKLIRYLKQLRHMHLQVPDFFRSKTDPKQFYHHLVAFCREHDIPEEIVHQVVPALIGYLETGHMRPVIFVGEKGCGKTTAVRMLVQEALQLYTEVIKIPQMDGGRCLTGYNRTYQSADVGPIARARLQADTLLVAYLFDEVDKVPRGGNRANIDDELLSLTDESCSDIFENYLEDTLVGLEYCPMFFTGNELQNISPILADRCTIITFPKATPERIQSIARKYVRNLMQSELYRMVDLDFALMDRHISFLTQRNVTSLRKHQQMIESVLHNALEIALNQEGDAVVSVTDDMFKQAEASILGAEKHRAGFLT